MSWFSLNPLKHLYDDDDDDEEEEEVEEESDIWAVSRQIRSVAKYLAPPASASSGIKSDLAEIGGTFKNTLSFLSNPNHFSKLASNLSFFHLGDQERDHHVNDGDDGDDDEDEDEDEDEEEEEQDYGAGVTDHVIEFARHISDRPHLWIDFPISPLDFTMSDAQSQHASIVQQFVPTLAHLKTHHHFHFWMVYFILLLPRLDVDHFQLLSTPQIIEARETLLMMLQMKKNEDTSSENSQSYSSSALDIKYDDAELVTTIENPNASSNTQSAVTSTQRDLMTNDPESSRILSREVAKSHENVDHSREEEGPIQKRFQAEDDVSFSDLEDDDNDLPNREPSTGSSQIKRNSSTEGSTDWVRLNEGTRDSRARGKSSSRDRDSEGEESSDWLTVDDFEP